MIVTLTEVQSARLREFIQELKDCKDLAEDWTNQEWCEYLNKWMDTESNFKGYIRNNGARPTRPHNP